MRDKNEYVTSSGISLKETYVPLDSAALIKAKDIGSPGTFPFTRGIYPRMYTDRLWTMRQYSGFGTAEATNTRFRFLLKRGQTGLSTAFDLPTQIGYDADHAMARGEVGRVGVSISTLEDMETLLAGIPLEIISLSLTINATAIVLLGFLIAVARKRKISVANLSGTVQNDILKEYIARGTFIYPPAPSLRLCTDITEYCNAHLPRFYPISISGYHMREAGATAVQEIAFTMVHAIAYVEELRKRGLAFDAIGKSISFFFNVHNDFFEEIAKFRAARKIWAHLAKKRFGARNVDSMKLRFHAQTAGSTLTYQRPKNNLTRVTYQALAAVLGGAQSLHTNSWDEALGLPSEESAKTALRIQQIIAHETGVTAVADPLGGSYFVETLTKEIETRAMALIDEIDAMGGALRAMENHWIQDAIHASAYAAQQAMENNRKSVVGVTLFPDKNEKIPKPQGYDASHQKQQIQRLARYRMQRNRRALDNALEQLKSHARGTTNLVVPVLKAIDAKATLGEISDALRDVFGEHKP